MARSVPAQAAMIAPRQAPPAAATSTMGPEAELPIRLGVALLQYGSSVAGALEAMQAMARRLGVPLTLLPGAAQIVVVLGAPGGHVRVVPVPPARMSLAQLRRLHEYAERLLQSAGTIDAQRALDELETVCATAPTPGRPWSALFAGLLCAAMAGIFGGGWPEVLAGGVGGLVAFLAMGALLPAVRGSETGRFLATVLVVLVVGALPLVMGPVDLSRAILPAVFPLLPSLGIYQFTQEIARSQYAVGSQRLVEVGTALLAIVSGVVVGASLIRLLSVIPVAAPAEPLPAWGLLAAVAGLLVGFWALLGGTRQDFAWMAGSLLFGLLAHGVAGGLPGPLLGTFVAVLAVALVSCLLAPRLGLPARALMLPGILATLPVQTALRIMLGMISNNTLDEAPGLFEALLVLGVVAAAVITAETVVREQPGPRPADGLGAAHGDR